MSKVIEEAKKYTHFDGSSKYSNSSFQLILDLITELESKNKEIELYEKVKQELVSEMEKAAKFFGSEGYPVRRMTDLVRQYKEQDNE